MQFRPYQPIKVIITPDMLKRAIDKFSGTMNGTSFKKAVMEAAGEEGQDGNVIGHLGEEMIRAIRPAYQYASCDDYDFLFRGLRIEVKTKHQSVPTDPLWRYEASFAVASLHQDFDHLVFCRVWQVSEFEFPYGWVVGHISKANFMRRSTLLPKGAIDPDNGYAVKRTCRNIIHSMLKPMGRYGIEKHYMEYALAGVDFGK